ncbi:alpha/beta hydrolase [Asanoa sp. WMMD1127]|uniref:alpha/beta fold hydrolase n=1 Tax=Asanoa sp. WMMD1127 TaxID=3016107 RepID=UPI002416E5CD|nr:alpha/beta hydrolase [Asanoa sp. WMMD1127]MDG4825855.1 alpha/beta hydrolase [Asanoa sp. WMMD1127]
MAVNYLERGTGRRIAYDVQGEGPLVIGLHGMGDLRSVYRFTVPALVEAGYRVATFDSRGHGDSSDGFDAYDDVAQATDTLALIDHLGGGPAALLGNSMGAGAAVYAAAERPDAVAALGLFGPFVRDPKLSAAAKLSISLLLRKPWGPGAWASYYKRYYPGRPPADLADHQRRIKESLRGGDHLASFRATAGTSHAPAEQRLSSVDQPALVVMGDKDPDWPDPTEEARFVADALRAELVLVPGAGHYPMAERPDLVNPALVAFLGKAFPSA